MKKYGFTNETITRNGHKLYRIVALRNCVKDFVTFIKKNIKDAADKEKCLERLQVVNENYCKRFK